MPYAAPVDEMRFVIETVAPLDGEAAELAPAILGEAARFAAAELDPLNQPADRIGSVLENGIVRTPPGFREAYRRYVDAGWMGLQCDPDYGGQGLPMSLATAHFGWGLTGIWIGLSAFIWIRFVAGMARWAGRRWLVGGTRMVDEAVDGV